MSLTYYRVYADMGRRHETGNCLAVERDEGQTTHRGIGPASYEERDAEVGPVYVNETFLRSRCKRVARTTAREEHPQLAEYLDDGDYIPPAQDRWQMSEGAY